MDRIDWRGKGFGAAVVAVLLLLLATAGSLPAAAAADCFATAGNDVAIELCDTSAVGETDDGCGCGEYLCACAACHCCHSAGVHAAVADVAPHALDREPPAATKRLISTANSGLERPPRV